MEKLSLARECGLRCRRIRMAKNMSQQDLADLLFTTPQNISKYEKEGISNIDTIKRISDVLGQDLLTDETDVEGTVGEIGKEILHTLISHKGLIEVKSLIENKMYGMSMDRVTHEIFKLERIGMCVREQFADWFGVAQDILFITAKGVITYKNLTMNFVMFGELYNELESVKTYEQIVGDADNYQEYIDSNMAQKLIRSIMYPSSFRPFENGEAIVMHSCYKANYIQYLKLHHETGIDAMCDAVQDGYAGEPHRSIPAAGIYHDILYRMALKITDEVMWNRCLCVEEFDDVDILYCEFLDELGIVDINGAMSNARKAFDSEFPWLSEWNDEVQKAPTQVLSSKEELEELYKKWGMSKKEIDDEIELYEKTEETVMDRFLDLDEELKKNRPDGKPGYPMTWFTDDQIRDFINEYFGPAETEQEKELDQVLKKINELMPETLEYYRFPNEWQDNGLADLVRKNAGITKE